MSEVEHKKCKGCRCYRVLSSFLNAKGRQLKTCSGCREKGRIEQKKRNAKKRASGVKHQCPKCDSKFSQKGHLNVHIKMIHDKIKDFECPNCDSKFSTKGSLTRHIKQVHDKIKDFECPKCNSKFSTKGHLTRHIKICTGELKMSAGEFKIMNTLKSMMIEFKREYTIPNLRSNTGGRLRYDFYLPKYGLYIEYDGRQHYEPVRFGGTSEKKAWELFNKTQANDKIKNEYAGNNLLRIKYTNYLLVPELVFKFITDKTDWDSDERH